jgi:hypothetical protein
MMNKDIRRCCNSDGVVYKCAAAVAEWVFILAAVSNE